MSIRRVAAAIPLLLLAACGPAPIPDATNTPSPLRVEVLYPLSETELEMGQGLRMIVRVRAEDGTPLLGARVTASILDPNGQPMGELEAEGDDQGVYRSPAWIVPHRSLAGAWRLQTTAAGSEAEGSAASAFQVRPSTSEDLLARYGFWLDAPTLRGIVPSLAGEFGDAHNGRILWGGVLPAAHILPAAWIEIQWREGERPLGNEEDVLRFFREDLGRFGFTAIRSLGPVTPLTFKDWAGWRVAARGQFYFDQVEWIVFYAPEVDRTYALGTTVVLPPTGIDAPAALLAGFSIDPETDARGVAPAPLPVLLPAPERQGPPLGAEFQGEVPVVLSWNWIRPLAEDEVFQVDVDYNYEEANPRRTYTTRQSQLALPISLYQAPNCRVFNWRVSVVRRDPASARSEPVSYGSLYAYLLWSYPSAEARPFPPRCPNAQY